MNITKIEINKNIEVDNLIALVNIILDNQFKIENIQLMNGNKGMYLLFPRNKNYHYTCYPIKEEIRKEILEKILQVL